MIRDIETGWGITYSFDAIDSTNLEALRRGREGADEGTLFVAEHQSAGRGRRGRNWDSHDEAGIYMTILLRPELPVNEAKILTIISAMAICRVMRENGIDAWIKWPNDVVAGGRKLVGILSEMELTGEGYFVVTGMGLNVNNRSFGEELPNASSMYLETGHSFDRRKLIEAIMYYYKDYYEFVKEAGSLAPVLSEYNQMLVNYGKEVRILDPKGEWTGQSGGIDAHGSLLVTDRTGVCREVSAGEVSVRGIYGYV